MKKSSYILSLAAILVAAASLQAQVTVDKTQLTFAAQLGSTPAPTQTLTVSSTTSGTGYTATTNAQGAAVAWLKVSNSIYPVPQFSINGFTGQASAVITVTADPTGLSAGSYTGLILINSVTVTVVMNIGSIGATPQTLAYSYQSGATLPPAQTLTLTGTGSFAVTASETTGGNWLTFTPTGGTLPTTSTVSVGVDPTITPTLAAGTYNGQIIITPVGQANNTPATIPVTLTVTGQPTITVSPSPITLNYQNGGVNNPTGQTLSISTTSQQPGNFPFSVIPSPLNNGVNAIQATPSSGNFPGGGTQQVTLSYNSAAALQPNTYTGSVTINTPGQSPAQTPVPLTLLISNSPLLSVSSSALNFLYEVNGTPAPTQQITTSSSAALPTAPNAQQMQISYAVTQGQNWLTVTPPTGIAPNQVFTGSAMPLTVSVNPAGLAPGKYTGNISITGAGAANGAQNVQVTLTVANDPVIITNAASNGLFFQSQIGFSPVAASQTSQAITIASSNGGTLNYTVAAVAANNGTWLSATPASGAVNGTPGTITVAVNPAGLAKGPYTGTVTITATNPVTGNQALGSPLTIPVTLYVDPNPMLVPGLPGNPPAPPTFTTTVNGTAPTQIITMSSTNPAAPLTYTVQTAPGANWLSVLPSGGSTPTGFNAISVQVSPFGLAPGNYSGTILVTSAGAANSPVSIPVLLTVSSGTISLNPATLNFSLATGGTAPAQTVQVTTSGSQLTYSAVGAPNSGTVNWLSVTPASGTTPGTVSVSVDASKLTAGTYTGTVTVSAPNATSASLPVTLTVASGTISAPTTTLTFTQAAGATAPASQSIAVTGSPSALNFNVTTAVTSGSGWLSAVVGSTGTAASGTTPATVNVSVNAGSLPVGQYQGSVTITSSGAAGSPIVVPVVLNVVAPQNLALSSTTPLAFNYTIGVTPVPLTQTVTLTAPASAAFTAAASAANNGTWLSVSPTSGTASTTPTTLTVSVNPAGLTAGSYSGTVTINSPSSLTPLTLQVNLTVSAVVPPTLVAIKNSASYAASAVAPGELVIIGGTNVGPAMLAYGTVSNNQLSTNVGGTQVFFDNTAAPIYYASATQTAVFVPYEVNGRATTVVTVVTQGASSAPSTYNVVTAQPGIFTQNSQGSGPGSILNPDNTVNGPNNGVAGGSYIQVFMTGEGQTSPAGVTGSVIPSNGTGLKTPVGTVTASIGGVPLPASAILYAGSAPGDVSGVFQVDLVVPSGLSPGPQPLVISVGGIASQAGVTVQVK